MSQTLLRDSRFRNEQEPGPILKEIPSLIMESNK